MSYLFELHYHTPQTSYCGNVPPAQALPKYKEAGYAGVVVTDHFYKEWFEDKGDLPWEEKVELWLKGYRAARETADQLGDFTVLLGMELRFTDNINDHLVYGIDEALLKEYPEPYLMTPAEFRAFADAHGLFFAQAHPFRSVCSPRNPADLHGVEVFNGNGRWDSHNDQARAFAEENGLVQLSGSDFHEWEDLCTGGVYLTQRPADSKALARLLFDGGAERLAQSE
ncbi:MAG: hypothetical protein HFE86_05015 [Clostridiales bacterium]|nr:hypothetical protein [Clostridiales bacterium]